MKLTAEQKKELERTELRLQVTSENLRKSVVAKLNGSAKVDSDVWEEYERWGYK